MHLLLLYFHMLNYLGVYVHVLIVTKRLVILTSIITIYLFSILLSYNIMILYGYLTLLQIMQVAQIQVLI